MEFRLEGLILLDPNARHLEELGLGDAVNGRVHGIEKLVAHIDRLWARVHELASLLAVGLEGVHKRTVLSAVEDTITIGIGGSEVSGGLSHLFLRERWVSSVLCEDLSSLVLLSLGLVGSGVL